MRRVTWKTSITDAAATTIRVRGYDLNDLIGRVSFAEMAYLLWRGELPPPNTRRMLDAMLVAAADHGIVASSIVARYVTAAGTPLQGAVAAGLLTVGDVYAGAVEQAARWLALAATRGGGATAVRELVGETLARGERVPGFGHPLHPDGDPRARRLLQVGLELGVAGLHCQLVPAAEAELAERKNARLPVNTDGAFAALALDLGFAPADTRALILLSRAAGILAHALEERRAGQPWRLPPPAEYDLTDHEPYYEGPPPRLLPPR